MNQELLTEKSSRDVKQRIEERCGRMALPAVDEVFEDAWLHGKNQMCQLVENCDHLLVVIDNDCPDEIDHRHERRNSSVMNALFKEGMVLYYYHSIRNKHHHVCLALKKGID